MFINCIFCEVFVHLVFFSNMGVIFFVWYFFSPHQANTFFFLISCVFPFFPPLTRCYFPDVIRWLFDRTQLFLSYATFSLHTLFVFFTNGRKFPQEVLKYMMVFLIFIYSDVRVKSVITQYFPPFFLLVSLFSFPLFPFYVLYYFIFSCRCFLLMVICFIFFLSGLIFSYTDIFLRSFFL